MADGSWVQLVGGLGLILLAADWIALGAGGVLQPLFASLPLRARERRRALAAGGLLSASLLGGRDTPTLVRRLGTAYRLPPVRVALLCVGTGGGIVAVGALAYAVACGRLLPAVALVGLFAAATAPLFRRSWTEWSRFAAGWALAVLALAVMQTGWEGIVPAAPAWLGAQGASGAILLCLLAAGAAWISRSPFAVACLAVQGTASGALHLGAGLALVAGAVLGSVSDSLATVRRGAVADRCIAGVHLAACVLWSALVIAVLIGLSGVLGSLSAMPGGPAAALLAVWVVGGLVTAGAAIALGDALETFVRNRVQHAQAEAPLDRLEWYGVPEVLTADLLSMLGESAARTAAAARETLGSEKPRKATRELALANRGCALAAVEELVSSHRTDSVPLCVGCDLQAAQRAAHGLDLATELLLQPVESQGLGVPELDLERLRARLAAGQLAQLAAGAHANPDRDAWLTQLDATRTLTWELWNGALEAGATGQVAAYQLGALKSELDWLEAVARELDLYVAEVAGLVGDRAPVSALQATPEANSGPIPVVPIGRVVDPAV